jgi:hypothetical protein
MTCGWPEGCEDHGPTIRVLKGKELLGEFCPPHAGLTILRVVRPDLFARAEGVPPVQRYGRGRTVAVYGRSTDVSVHQEGR